MKVPREVCGAVYAVEERLVAVLRVDGGSRLEFEYRYHFENQVSVQFSLRDKREGRGLKAMRDCSLDAENGPFYCVIYTDWRLQLKPHEFIPILERIFHESSVQVTYRSGPEVRGDGYDLMLRKFVQDHLRYTPANAWRFGIV